jgi:DNA polymerase-1
MDSLALKYLGHQTTHYEDIAGKGAKQISFSQVSIKDAGHYAAEDADITLRLHQHLWPKLQATPSLEKVLSDLEVPLIPVLARMEQAGVLIDGKLLKQQSTELANRMHELEGQAHEAAGQPFNLGSPKQLQQILFEKLELPVIRKTPKGQPSTAEDVLKELADKYTSSRPIRTSYRHRSTRIPVVSIRPITRPWLPPAGCHPQIRIYRTFRSAHPRAARYARHLWHRRAT